MTRVTENEQANHGDPGVSRDEAAVWRGRLREHAAKMQQVRDKDRNSETNCPDPNGRSAAFQASGSGATTTGAHRVRNTPPRIRAAPADCAAVIGSPIHSQPTIIAVIGVRLL